MIPFIFSSLAIRAVGEADACGRIKTIQNIPGIIGGNSKPE